MTDPDVIRQLSDVQIVGLTLFGEARSQGVDGMRAVADVIRNRVHAKRFGFGFRAVCLRPWQFSCWRVEGGARNYELLLDAGRTLLRPDAVIGPLLRQCLVVAHDVMSEQPHESRVGAATHYMTRALWASQPPAWARGLTPTCSIGEHVFFAGVT